MRPAATAPIPRSAPWPAAVSATFSSSTAIASTTTNGTDSMPAKPATAPRHPK